MTTWNPRANELFLKALELCAPGARQAYLDGACAADAALRAEVEALLDAGARAGSFLEAPATAAHLVATIGEPRVAERPGATIGPYQLLEQIGEGGMSTVFLAEQTRPVQRKVALKVLKPGMDQLARFRAEAEAVACLEHPNIVQLYEVSENDGRPYLALEYVPGTSLRERLKEKRLSVEEAARLVETLARAIHYAHQHGIVHRDLKPANILLQRTAPPLDDGGTRAGLHVPKIADFGLAKRLDVDQGQTPSGAILGTPSYMAPEQARGTSKRSGPAADIYSLGAILYELLVGRPPFRGETILDTLVKAISQKPIAPRRQEADIPTGLERICLKCLQKDPAQRYPSAEALAEDLRRFLTGGPPPDEPPTVVDPERGPRRARGLRRRLFLAGGLAVLLLGGLLLLLRVASQPRTPSRQDDPAQLPVAQLPTTGVGGQAPLVERKSQKPLPGPQKDKGGEGEREKAAQQRKDAPHQPAGKRGETNPGGPLDAPFAPPDLQISIPAPPLRGWLAVQAPADVHAKYAAGSGAVVLILDCSGSMMTALPGGTTRFQEAVRALYQVLQGIPKGTQVSLWAFSHVVNLDTGKSMRNHAPEDTIQRVFFHKNWEATDDAMNQIRARVKPLVPYNVTPIVRSMMSAVEDFKDCRGFKNLVILTDGMDNRFEKQRGSKWGGDPVLNPGGKLTIPQFIEKTFSKKPYKDVAIRVIGFQLPPGEEADSVRQFKAPLERLPTKGRFYLVGDTVDLTAKLKDSIKQRLFFTLEEGNGRPVKGLKGGIDVSRQGTDAHWVDLKPGHYWVVVDARKELRQKVEIRPGDRLRLNLFEKGDGFVLQRDPVEKAFPGVSFPKAKARDRLLTVLQNQRLLTEDAVQMMVVVENLRDREFGGEGAGGHVTPSLILFQVKPPPDVKAAPPSLRYRPLADYAAPSWGLEVRPWLRSAAPVLEAFWSENPPDYAAVLRKGRHFSKDLQVLPEGNSFELQLSKGERGSVRLLSLDVEKHSVDTCDGKRQELCCLVVRMSFPPGRPVMAQLPNFSGGQEHQFSTEAGQYTGLFWEMTPQQAPQAVEALNLISLTGFREAALASGRHVRIELSVPDNNPRPNPGPDR